MKIKLDELPTLIGKIGILRDSKTGEEVQCEIKDVNANKTFRVKNLKTKSNCKIVKETLELYGNPDLIFQLPDGYEGIELPETFSKIVNAKGAIKQKSVTNRLYCLNTDKINELLTSEKKLAPQCRVVLTALIEDGSEQFTIPDIKNVISGKIKTEELKTKQEPFVIFNYYFYKFLEKEGYIYTTFID